MTNENLRQFLDRRKKELTHLQTALRGQLKPIEAELAEIERVRQSLNEQDVPETQAPVVYGLLAGMAAAAPTFSMAEELQNLAATTAGGAAAAKAALSDEPTIKTLITMALRDTGELSAAQLREYIMDGYGRAIEPASLRSQLHRLKGEGLIEQDETTQRWRQRDMRGALGRMEWPSKVGKK